MLILSSSKDLSSQSYNIRLPVSLSTHERWIHKLKQKGASPNIFDTGIYTTRKQIFTLPIQFFSPRYLHHPQAANAQIFTLPGIYTTRKQ